MPATIVAGQVSGGDKRKTEKNRFKNGINVLVSTPGRFCDHLQNTENLKMDKVQVLVLDEADRHLELGYESDVKKIVAAIDESNLSGAHLYGLLHVHDQINLKKFSWPYVVSISSSLPFLTLLNSVPK